MRFLLYGNLTPAVAEAVRRHGHVAADLAAADLPADVAPEDLPAHLQRKQLDLLTCDADLVGRLIEPGGLPAKFDRCAVFLQLAGGDVEQDDAIDRLFTRYARLSPRRLYTVTETRVKVRQLPGA